MNRLKKIIVVVTGIAACVGLWSLVMDGPNKCVGEARPYPSTGRYSVRKSGEGNNTLAHLTLPDLPSATRLVPGYCWEICEKCAQKYQVPNFCTLGSIIKEEIRHQHLNPNEKAEAIKQVRLKWHEMAESGRSLPPSKRKLLLQRIHKALQYEIEAYQ